MKALIVVAFAFAECGEVMVPAPCVGGG